MLQKLDNVYKKMRKFAKYEKFVGKVLGDKKFGSYTWLLGRIGRRLGTLVVPCAYDYKHEKAKE